MSQRQGIKQSAKGTASTVYVTNCVTSHGHIMQLLAVIVNISLEKEGGVAVGLDQ
jgi:hypothetical protein